jgi:hypothetical protein
VLGDEGQDRVVLSVDEDEVIHQKLFGQRVEALLNWTWRIKERADLKTIPTS